MPQAPELEEEKEMRCQEELFADKKPVYNK